MKNFSFGDSHVFRLLYLQFKLPHCFLSLRLRKANCFSCSMIIGSGNEALIMCKEYLCIQAVEILFGRPILAVVAL